MWAGRLLCFGNVGLRLGFGTGRVHLAPVGSLGCCLIKGGGSVTVDPLFIVAPIICVGFVFDLCFLM